MIKESNNLIIVLDPVDSKKKLLNSPKYPNMHTHTHTHTYIYIYSYQAQYYVVRQKNIRKVKGYKYKVNVMIILMKK